VHCRAYAANAVWALVYNNQKGKAAFKVEPLTVGDRFVLPCAFACMLRPSDDDADLFAH
jgi:hypothetical protein